ncbi:hypothetical protein ASG53_15440 [Sanguibacter sp. Leaf3]|nr:hypothetical protein ASG53_15440 [Sanguibacter sp. Leaf3]
MCRVDLEGERILGRTSGDHVRTDGELLRSPEPHLSSRLREQILLTDRRIEAMEAIREMCDTTGPDRLRSAWTRLDLECRPDRFLRELGVVPSSSSSC